MLVPQRSASTEQLCKWTSNIPFVFCADTAAEVERVCLDWVREWASQHMGRDGDSGPQNEYLHLQFEHIEQRTCKRPRARRCLCASCMAVNRLNGDNDVLDIGCVLSWVERPEDRRVVGIVERIKDGDIGLLLAGELYICAKRNDGEKGSSGRERQ